MAGAPFLPGTGRWQPAGLTEGTLVPERQCGGRIPTTVLWTVPLPVPRRL
jgi:hypothetical protein